MRSESGVSLVSGALQSSLARVQKSKQKLLNNNNNNTKALKKGEEGEGQHLSNGNHHHPNKSNNKGNNKHRSSSYFDIIGSQFASYSSDQFLELGNSLNFDDGGFLTRTVPQEVKKECAILLQNNTSRLEEEKGSSLRGEGRKLSKDNAGNKAPLVVVPVHLQNGSLSSPNKESGDDEPNTTNGTSPHQNGLSPKKIGEENNNTKRKKTDLGGVIERFKELLKDNTIKKNKRRRLAKKLKLLQKKQAEELLLTPTKKKKEGSQNQSPVKSPVSSTSSSPLKTNRGKIMGPESEKREPSLNGSTSSSSTSSTSSSPQLPEPKRILYPKENIVLGWRTKRGPGAGFHNFGNTCYLNSSLQALFHVPAFVNWITTDEEHRRNCKGLLPNQTPCIICVVHATLQEHSRSGSAIRPRVLDKLKVICKHFSYGRQEDAHEFLRYLLEGMERSYLALINGLRLDNRTKETNPLGQIFGGYIRTEVTCLQCNFTSTTFQPSAELQLDIRHSTTLEDALNFHFRRERLDNNDYRCERCRKISQATKQFSLELPPLVLCLQLKRFTLYGGKISKRIHCNRFLNMSKFLHKSRKTSGFYQEKELKYRLVALVTHIGQSPNCGHYTAVAEGANGSYYNFDDQFVQEIGVQQALNNDAYVIIYEMDRNSLPATQSNARTNNAAFSNKPSTAISAASSLSNGNSNGVVKKFAVPFSKTNGVNGSTAKPSVIENKDPNKAKLNGPVLSTNRPLVRFGISGSPLKSTPPASPNKICILQPGVAVTNSSRIYTTPTLTPKSDVAASQKPIKLVPYNDVDNDDSDSDENQAKEEKPAQGKIIGPVLPPQMQKSAKGGNDRSVSPSPDRKFGVKRKLEDMLKTSATKSDKEVKKDPINATTEWIVTPKSGYSSDPESSTKKNKGSSRLNGRAKSVERVSLGHNVSKTVSNAPLIPNNKGTGKINGIEETSQEGMEAPKLKETSENKNCPNDAANRGSPDATRKQKKRKRSDSSSSASSSSSSSVERKKKKKKKHVKKKRDSSSSSESGSDSKWDKNEKGRSSLEREELLRKARNPSRSPSKSKFDPTELRAKEKSIVAWGDEKSVLSKTLEQEKSAKTERSKEEFDEELDTGRVKKQRTSRSPSREDSGPNRFQGIQDKKVLVKKWSSLLNGYGDGFKDHSKFRSNDRKSWSDKGAGHSHHKKFDEHPRHGGGSYKRFHSSDRRDYHRPHSGTGNGHRNFNPHQRWRNNH